MPAHTHTARRTKYLRNHIDNLQSDMRRLVTDLGHVGHHGVHHAREGVGRVISSARETGREAADRMRGRVSRNPLSFIAGALATGLLLGWFARHRRK